ncbi:MAG: monovalent cation/H(+) antiporter subunit G, partial [Chloroflexota bacterium]
TPFDRLHYLAPLLLGLFALAVALTLAQGFSTLSLKAWAVWVLAVISGPIVTHAASRAARVRQFASWQVLESEKAEARS